MIDLVSSVIKFCPKCGSMMVPEKVEGKVIWKCRKCGYQEDGDGKEKIVVKQEINNKKTIPVVDLDKTKDKISTIDVECPKCSKHSMIRTEVANIDLSAISGLLKI